MNTPPVVTINGKKYPMPKPKIKIWRHIIKFTEAQQNGELEGEKMLDEMTNLVVMAFNHPDVTAEAIEENMDFEELGSLFGYISRRVTGTANAKASQFPNAGTPAGT